MTTGRDVATLQSRIVALETALARVPLRTWPAPPRQEVLQIIGGNLVGAIGCITYSATDPTLANLYDPDVDTVYPSGLGNAWCMDESGRPRNRVLVRHDFAGATAPLVGGWVYLSRGTTRLVVASGPNAGAVLSAYLVTWTV